MNIKLSHYTPRKSEEVLITPKVSTSTKKITLEEICLESDVIHVMRKDTMLENVLETKMALTRRRKAIKYIMLTLQMMMNLLERKPKKKVKILLVKLFEHESPHKVKLGDDY